MTRGIYGTNVQLGSVTKVASRGGGVKEAILSNMDLIESAVLDAVPELEYVQAAANGAKKVYEAATSSEETSPAAVEEKPRAPITGDRCICRIYRWPYACYKCCQAVVFRYVGVILVLKLT